MKRQWGKMLAWGLTVSLSSAGLAACGGNQTTPSQGPVATESEENMATAETEATEAEGVSGTFEGTSPGMQGPVTVSVEVDNGMITAIDFVENSETPYVAAVANERIPQQIIEHQSLSVDTVTGATITSNAIMRAVGNAVENSGLDINALKDHKVTASPKEDQVWDTDVLVMGGGGAGFTAAITAAQQGAKVILIEKSSVLGGNTMMAGSAYNAVDEEAQSLMLLTKAQQDTLDAYLKLSEADEVLKLDEFPEWKEVLSQLQSDIKAFYAANEGKKVGEDMPGFDSVSLHMWHIYTGGLRQLETGEWIASDIALARVLATDALPAFEWMDEIGLESVYGGEAEGGLTTVLGAMWPRTHDFMRKDARIVQLLEVAESCGVTVYTETAGTELLVEDGRVTGALAEQADGTKITIHTTKGVVLATGGYCANPAMVKEYDAYWGDDLSAHTLSTNLGTNEGDGIVMAESIGAALTGMEIAQMMPSSSPVKGTMTDGVWADAAAQIWIDGNGSRFVNEYAERDVLAKASLALDQGIFYIIYAGGDGEGAGLDEVTYFGDRIGDLVDNDQIWYGETLAELAAATGTAAAGATPAFSEEALRATIEQYNEYVANQKDDDFGKEVLTGAINLETIEATDGLGICITPRKASLHHTMGGVVIDTEARVLNNEGKVIEGLWAAGEVTGGIHAGNRLGGNAITDIFTYGRIAGANAAQ